MDAGDYHLHALTVVFQHAGFFGLLAALLKVFLVGAVAQGIIAGIVKSIDDFALKLVGTAVGIDLFFEQSNLSIVVAALIAEQVLVLLHLVHVVILLPIELVLQLVEHAVEVVLTRSLGSTLRVGVQSLLKFINMGEILLFSLLVLLH